MYKTIKNLRWYMDSVSNHRNNIRLSYTKFHSCCYSSVLNEVMGLTTYLKTPTTNE